MSEETETVCAQNLTEVSKLFKAIKSNNIKLVKHVLKKKTAETNSLNPEDQSETAFLLACRLNREEIVSILLEDKTKPADVNFENNAGIRPIWVAVQTGNLDLTKLLLSTGRCQVNYIHSESGYTPLMKAITSSQTEIVHQLIHAGADVNIRRHLENSDDITPLIQAVQIGNKDICEMLIDSLCDLQAKTCKGLTALHYAVAYCRYEICELLLWNKIKLHASTRHGATAMTFAICHNIPRMVQILIDNGYKLNSKYKFFETPLEQAIKLHREDCAIVLVKNGCTIIRPKTEESYFKMAVNERIFRLMRLLVGVYPPYLREKWIRRGDDWPISICNSKNIILWLYEKASNPETLFNLCRSKIFRVLKHQPGRKVSRLPIPTPLQVRIVYPEHEVKQRSLEKLIHDDYCPQDCPVKCPNKFCPSLDISDSEEEDDF